MPIQNDGPATGPGNRQGSGSGGGNAFLYFAVGALIVAVGVLGWMTYTGSQNKTASDTALERMADSVGEAAENVGESARKAVDNIPAAPVPTPAPQPAPAPGN
jgi:hypothetical protein